MANPVRLCTPRALTHAAIDATRAKPSAPLAHAPAVRGPLDITSHATDAATYSDRIAPTSAPSITLSPTANPAMATRAHPRQPASPAAPGFRHPNAKNTNPSA